MEVFASGCHLLLREWDLLVTVTVKLWPTNSLITVTDLYGEVYSFNDGSREKKEVGSILSTFFKIILVH